MKPVFVINALSETVAKKGSKLAGLTSRAAAVFDEHIFDNLNLIVEAGCEAGWVIIEGGDGTAQGIISAFFNRISVDADMPKFTLLPGGMTNQIAKNIGLKAFSLKGIAGLLDGKGANKKQVLLQVSCEGQPNLYGFVFSTGGVPMVTQYTKTKLHSKGVGGSAAVVGGIIKGISGKDKSVLYPTQITVRVDDKLIEGSHLGTLVTTLPSLLLRLDPFWGNGSQPLRLTFVEGEPKHLARNVVGLWLGRKDKDRGSDGLHSYRAAQLDYQYGGPIVLDGEPLSIQINFKVSPTQPLTFVS